jgi:hypothetical protein
MKMLASYLRQLNNMMDLNMGLYRSMFVRKTFVADFFCSSPVSRKNTV